MTHIIKLGSVQKNIGIDRELKVENPEAVKMPYVMKHGESHSEDK